MSIPGWTTLSSSDLWDAWRGQFPTLAHAEVEALWIANRLVKTAARSTKSSLYEVKDLFVAYAQPWLIDGQKVRDEIRSCHACNGRPFAEEDEEDEWCERCAGTGIWSQRTLYLHQLDIDGRRFAFHSYVAPCRVSDTPGADLEQYGGSFTEQELAAFSLPMSGLLRLLRYHAFAHGFGVEADGARPADSLHDAPPRLPPPEQLNLLEVGR